MATIETVDLVKRFDRTEVLRGVSLTVGDGEIAALLGPSGCGKSTTLFLLAGLYQPSGGDVRFDGASVLRVPPRERRVGLVFQSYALYPHLSVRDNIGFPLRLEGVSRAERARRVGEAAELAGLGELLDRRPSQLSGGQQQRVAVARAIVKRPRLLLMDEPLSNLDLELRARLRRELKRVQRETGVTTIIVTHDQEEAMSLADRIYVMAGGEVQQAGDHRDLYARPANRFVAGFIGTPAMSFFAALGRAREGDALWLTAGGQRLARIDPAGALAGAALDGATLGIRPEHVAVTPTPGDDLPAVVADLVPAGRETLVGLTLPGGGELRAIVPSTLPLSLEQAVAIRIDERFVHLFDTSGAALHHGSHVAQG